MPANSQQVPRIVEVQAVSMGIASASVFAGIIYYCLQIRRRTKVGQADLVKRAPC